MGKDLVRRGEAIARRVFGRRRRPGFAAIEVRSGQCFVAETPEEAYRKAAREHPRKRFFLADLSSPDFSSHCFPLV